MKNNQVFIDTLNRALPAVSPAVFPLGTEMKLPKILEENVGNFCPTCGKIIFSNLLEIDGKVYLEKNCCTKELVHLENDVDFFQKHKEYSQIKLFVSNPKNWQELISKNPDHPFMPIDMITTKCNMNCPICFLKYYKQEAPDLSLEAIKSMVEKYKYRSILLYTVEPTMREDLPEIIKIIKDSGNIPGIATNGLKLEDKNYLKELKKAGLKFIIFQFDGFNKEANIRFRGKDYLKNKLRALKNIKEVGGFHVNLSAVIEKGLNEGEIPNIIRLVRKNKFIDRITFVSLLPPPNKDATTTYSDLAKAMEKYGYFDREYFLETVKMNRNIHEVARKVFEGTPLENWILRKLPDSFNTICLFKKETDSLELFFQKGEIQKINKILAEIMSKNKKTGALLSFLKNSPKLINSPLLKVLGGRLMPLINKANRTPGVIEVSLTTPKSYINRLLDGHRSVQWSSQTLAFLASVGPLAFADPT